MHTPFAELDKSQFNFPPPPYPPEPEKESQKPLDIFARDLLEKNPELRTRLTAVLEDISEANKSLPLLHFTSGSIRNGEGLNTTGFTENIKSVGFEKANTNVAAFVDRGKTTELAEPLDYLDSPDKFIKSLCLIIQRYAHHGSRVNKERLGVNKNEGEGVPTLFLVDGTNVDLIKGSDYDDHYTLDSEVAPEQIIGELNLDSYRPYREHLPEIIAQIFDIMEKYYSV